MRVSGGRRKSPHRLNQPCHTNFHPLLTDLDLCQNFTCLIMRHQSGFRNNAVFQLVYASGPDHPVMSLWSQSLCAVPTQDRERPTPPLLPTDFDSSTSKTIPHRCFRPVTSAINQRSRSRTPARNHMQSDGILISYTRLIHLLSSHTNKTRSITRRST